MRTIVGIENLKDEFRRAKLKCGDHRGLKNRFELSARLGITGLETYYYAAGGNGDERMELVADCYDTKDSNHSIYAYTMSELVKEIRERAEIYEVNLICLKWNKERTDANRKEIARFYYKNS